MARLPRRRRTRKRSTAQDRLRWANNLLPEILTLIASKWTTSAAEYVSLRRVCSGWRHTLSVFAPFPPLPFPQLSFLLIPPQDFGIDCPLGYAYPLPFPSPSRPPASFPLPQLKNTQDCICIGSSHGWLIFLGPDSSLSLLNPVTADSILLPHLSSIDNTVLTFNKSSSHEPQYLITQNSICLSQLTIVRRVALSSDPVQDPRFTVLLFLSGLHNCCFMWRNSSTGWHLHFDEPFLVEDVLFVNGYLIPSTF